MTTLPDDCILVIMDKTNSMNQQCFKVEDFNSSNIESVTETFVLPDDFDSTYINTDNYRRVYRLNLKNKGKSNVLATIKEIESMDGIISVTPNYILKQSSVPSTTPVSYTNDPELSDNYYAYRKIQLQEAWRIETGSNTVNVGIIDSGVNNHEDLIANLGTGYDFVNDNEITSDDEKCHGTYVAGIIGSVGNNGVGISGVCRDVNLIPLQVDEYGSPSEEAVANAILYAGLHNIPIINASIQSQSDIALIRLALKTYKGLFVTVAGNDANSLDTTNAYPACYDYDNIIVVGASTQYDALLEGTNYSSVYVDLFAPGDNVISTYGTDEYIWPSKIIGDWIIRFNQGTSFAAPLVAGAAALLLSYNPDLTTADVNSDGLINSVDALCVSKYDQNIIISFW